MVAELTDFAVAYWSGREVVYAFLRDDDNAKIEEEFDLTAYAWDEWRARGPVPEHGMVSAAAWGC
jgi:hypothetical protein